jgi:DNA-directed RNA polymerase specialized sigma24 family protein
MWNYLYELWRSVLRRTPPDKDPGAGPPSTGDRDALHEELRRLMEERSTLLNTAASYREFGYDELAERLQEQVAAVDHRIAALRLQLRRKEPARRG